MNRMQQDVRFPQSLKAGKDQPGRKQYGGNDNPDKMNRAGLEGAVEVGKIKAGHWNHGRCCEQDDKMLDRFRPGEGLKQDVSGCRKKHAEQENCQELERVQAGGQNPVDKQPKKAKLTANDIEWRESHTDAKIEINSIKQSAIIKNRQKLLKNKYSPLFGNRKRDLRPKCPKRGPFLPYDGLLSRYNAPFRILIPVK